MTSPPNDAITKVKAAQLVMNVSLAVLNVENDNLENADEYTALMIAHTCLCETRLALQMIEDGMYLELIAWDRNADSPV